jgi:L-lactate dehydrogenase (cytochrome)
MTTVVKEKTEESPDEKERMKRIQEMPLLEQCYNLLDFEAVARRVMKKTAWGYYSSAADDEIVSRLILPTQYHLINTLTHPDNA